MAARLLALIVAALVLAPAAAAADAPKNLHGFLLRADEAERPTHVFPRTPAFGWDPVPGARRYEFQLSTSKRFTENAIVWSNEDIGAPLTTVPITLPWISGARYAWYARVRAVVAGEETAWSRPYGFNMRAGRAPRSLSSTVPNPIPGMIRWTPVEGATAYEVLFLWEQSQGKAKKIVTATTAADLREVYTFHNGRDWANVTYWRVRAVREVAGTPQNNIPVVSYGPWSPRLRTVEPELGTGEIALRGTISRSRPGSDVLSADASGAPGPGPHELAPGFWWSGTTTPAPELLGACTDPDVVDLGVTCPLYRVYVYSDADCVNPVHVSDLVGSPAYVPRQSGSLDLPATETELKTALGLWLGDGEEVNTFAADGSTPVPSGLEAAEGTTASAAEEATEEGEATETAEAGEESGSARKNGLWDADWPTGRYYWTAVPTIVRLDLDKVTYHEVTFGQDMCTAGTALPFGKTSAPVTEKHSGVPFVSGLTPGGALAAATTANPGFFDRVLVSWKPAPGAGSYQLQWSKKKYPWRTAGTVETVSTSAVLDLPIGKWHYRVRGLDPTLPGPAGMTWSDPAKVTIVPRTFEVVSVRRR